MKADADQRSIPFNRPYMTGKELFYIAQAHFDGALAGDGPFTRRCHALLQQRTGCTKALLTHSCTAALEIAALLLDCAPGDEVIMPSYTFVSTANAFALRGATPVFVDVRGDTLNLDERLVEQAITPRTKAIVAVHYAGVACEMDALLAIATRHGLRVVEDAAQGVMSTYKGRPLGAIGDIGAYSFHETKNITSGEGGALLVNRAGARDTGRDRSREGHRPHALLPRRGRQVHVARGGIVVSGGRAGCRFPVGPARGGGADHRRAAGDLGPLPPLDRAARGGRLAAPAHHTCRLPP